MKLMGLFKAVRSFSKKALNGLKKIPGKRGQEKLLNDVKASDILAAVKLNEIVEDGGKKRTAEIVKIVLIVLAIVSVAALVVVAIYKYLTPEVIDDYEDELEDELDNDFFEDEDDEEEN
jgi:hypothetical protein